MRKPTLDIVIVDYNTGHLLHECLRSITVHLPRLAILQHVLVVDNASVDATSNYIKDLDLPLILIRNRVNRGFAAACNQGAVGSTADYLLFLNPDTRLLDGSLDIPVSFLERPENQVVGIVGIQLLDNDGTVAHTCSYQPRLIHFVNKVLGVDRISPDRFPTGFMTEWDHSENRQVDVVMGAFYLVRQPLFEELGGFDERFFVYFEECEFGLRARQKGYISLYLADAQAFHRGQGASDKVKSHRLYYSLQSRILYSRKHFGRFSAIVLLLITLLLEPVSRVLLALSRGSGVQVKETINGYVMLCSWLIRSCLGHDSKRTYTCGSRRVS